MMYMFFFWESLYDEIADIMKDYDVYSHLTFFCSGIIFYVYIYAELLLSITNYFSLLSQDT